MSNRISTYVSDSFSDEQKSVFNFLVSTFPEKLRMVNTGSELVEIESVYAVLALIAHMIGESRELINNTQYLRDIDYLRQNSSADTILEKSNAKARLLNALDLNATLLDERLTVEQQLEVIDNNPDFFLNAPEYINNRGTMATLKNIIEDFLLIKLSEPAKETGKVQGVNNPAAYDFTVDPDGANGAQLIQIETLIDDVPDPSASYIGDYYEIKRDSDLYKVINAVRPAGMIYTIIMLNKLNILENLASSLMAGVHSDNAPITSNDSLTTGPTISVSLVSYSDPNNPLVYEVTVTNPYEHLPVLVRVRDFSTTTYNKTLTHQEFLLGPGESLTKQFQSLSNYGYSTTVYIAAYLKVSTKTSPYNSSTKSIITSAEPPVVLPTLIDPVLTAGPTQVTYGGGEISVAIRNNNSVAVTAQVYWEFTDGGFNTDYGSETRSISGTSSVTYKKYTTLPVNSTCLIRVRLTAVGYDNSNYETVYIYNVPGSQLGEA